MFTTLASSIVSALLTLGEVDSDKACPAGDIKTENLFLTRRGVLSKSPALSPVS